MSEPSAAETSPADPALPPRPDAYGFDLLYEDGPVLVLGKPPGLLTQGPPGTDSLDLRIKRFLKQRENPPGGQYVVPVHRLDRPASGAILFARNVRVAKRLSRQFEERTVTKVYHALVEGTVGPEADTWTDTMRKVPDQPRSEIVAADVPGAQIAILTHRVLARIDGRTLLEIELGTGRTHQIRLQCAHRGHPVVGDETYGATGPFGPPIADERLRPIALHASRLAFTNPKTEARVDVTAPRPAVWAGVLGTS